MTAAPSGVVSLLVGVVVEFPTPTNAEWLQVLPVKIWAPSELGAGRRTTPAGHLAGGVALSSWLQGDGFSRGAHGYVA
ncbi:hypothetical protein QYE76_032534 [Lolium multiflorum]|uniref:Uncharacterized protein n=1 Tax=Lolium multiflorum TaxID=4521 RepID=A0AAD8QVA8_LOLMU|nr:hypothetical protein QYE76_032534 [Lolium multiflorum]